MLLILALCIFIAVFYCIITEKIPTPWATMLGGLTMSLLGIINQEEALEAISERLEILFLLIGMMMIVLLISETGIFQWFAIKVAQLVRGEPFSFNYFTMYHYCFVFCFFRQRNHYFIDGSGFYIISKATKVRPFSFCYFRSYGCKYRRISNSNW